MRLDNFLVEHGLCRSRARAKEAIEGAKVFVDGRCITKASFEVCGEENITAESNEKYVSRGGYKLERAIEAFGISLAGVTALDIGASTGGFTDCMLQNGAQEVFAVDAGHGQLAESIAGDCRVHNIEGCNIRSFDTSALPKIDFICTDVSFISLKHVFPKISEILTDGAAVCLIKPQFEAGRAALNKHGIVTDKTAREEVILSLRSAAEALGLGMRGLIKSPICGGDGNVEFLCLLKKGKSSSVTDAEVKKEVFSA